MPHAQAREEDVAGETKRTACASRAAAGLRARNKEDGMGKVALSTSATVMRGELGLSEGGFTAGGLIWCICDVWLFPPIFAKGKEFSLVPRKFGSGG